MSRNPHYRYNIKQLIELSGKILLDAYKKEQLNAEAYFEKEKYHLFNEEKKELMYVE